jgi:metal-responsive CopG/Arc/MetJ family transcriptional regulator
MASSIERRRAKISVTVDRGLLRAVDTYVEHHEGLDRSKVIDQALLDWYAARQNDAMIEQYTAPTTPQEDAEHTAWERIRDAAAADMLSRPRAEG